MGVMKRLMLEEMEREEQERQRKEDEESLELNRESPEDDMADDIEWDDDIIEDE